MREGSRVLSIGKILITVFLWIAIITVLFPYVWVILSSLKTPSELSHPTHLLFSPVLDNWVHVLTSQIPENFTTSLFVGIVTIVIALLVGLPAAYSISHYRTGGRATRFGILISEVVPPAVLVVPLFLTAVSLNVNGTILPIIIAHLTFVVPVVTWFLIGFFDSVPKEFEEQAMIDGCGRFKAFYRVIIPQIIPGIGAASIFGFILSWNDMFYALMLGGGHAKTLPVAIADYNTFRGIQLGDMSAAILISVIPILVLSFFVQKYLIRGIGGGGVKG